MMQTAGRLHVALMQPRLVQHYLFPMQNGCAGDIIVCLCCTAAV